MMKAGFSKRAFALAAVLLLLAPLTVFTSATLKQNYKNVTDNGGKIAAHTVKYVLAKCAALKDATGGGVYVYISDGTDGRTVDEEARYLCDVISADENAEEQSVITVIVIDTAEKTFAAATSSLGELNGKVLAAVDKCLGEAHAMYDLDDSVSFTVERVCDAYYTYYGVAEPNYKDYYSSVSVDGEDADAKGSALSNIINRISKLSFVQIVLIIGATLVVLHFIFKFKDGRNKQ